MNQHAYLEKLYWEDVRTQVKRVNSELFKIIEQISPSKNYPLFVANYSYGQEILKNGYLQVPVGKDKLLSITDSKLSASIRENLNYNLGSNPVTMPLEGCVELFLKKSNEKAVFPLYGLISKGKIFGLSKILSNSSFDYPHFIWGMTAGARSIFMLPKISNSVAHKRLQHELNISCSTPKNFWDHWNVFKEISKSTCVENVTWSTQLLYFPKEWFKNLKDYGWITFYNYLLKTAWDASEFARSQFFWNAVFAFIQENKNIPNDPYHFDVVKHLIMMGAGAVSGLAPAIDDTTAPVSTIRRIYEEVYDISYAPIVLQPLSFSFGMQRPVYYSLSYPNHFGFSKKSIQYSNKIVELDQIYYLLKKVLSEIIEGELDLQNTILSAAVNNVKYDFFHTDVKRYKGLIPASEIPRGDLNWLANMKNPFPEDSPFLRGCIRVSEK